MEAYLSVFMTYTQEDWAEYLPSAELAINNRNAASTGISPFFMTHGYNVNLIQINEQLEEWDENARLSLVTRGEQVIKKLLNVRNWVEAAIAIAQ